MKSERQAFRSCFEQGKNSSTHLCGCLWLTLTGPVADFRGTDELSSSILMLVRKRLLCKGNGITPFSYQKSTELARIATRINSYSTSHIYQVPDYVIVPDKHFERSGP